MSSPAPAGPAPGEGEDETGGTVELSFPVRPDLVFLARMTGTAVASRAGFGIDQVEDLRLAIDELCLTVTGGGEDGRRRLRLSFEWGDHAIRVHGRLEAPAGDGATPAATPETEAEATSTELSERILDALVDEHGSEHVDGVTRAWMVVRRRHRP